MAQKRAPKTKGIRLSDNDFVEALTHVHALVPIVFWTPIISFLLWRGVSTHEFSPVVMGALAVAGLITWTFMEYLIHRYFFHWTTKNPFFEKVVYAGHGIHHDDPHDFTRILMPPFGGVVIAAPIYLFFWMIMGAEMVQPFFGFFLIGYLIYDYTHFCVHKLKPRGKILKYLHFHHMQHHYVSPNTRWGVSSPLWDVIFGTLEKTERLKTS